MSASTTAELPRIDSAVDPTGGSVRFHLSLNVANLDRSIEFFRAFFGVEPAKWRSDYAKFELNEPPLVLSLEPFAAPPGGNLNHLGFRMPSSELLVECQRRLEMAGISTKREEGVECCYSRQTKFWVVDPDKNMWELYTLEEDLNHCGEGQKLEVILSSKWDGGQQLKEDPAGSTPVEPVASHAAPSLWNHRLGQPLPPRLPILDATVDRVELQGSLNMASADADATDRFVGELFRILKPGGSIGLHCLTADRPLAAGKLGLPGPASMVERVPVDRDVIQSLERAGLADIEFTKLGVRPCFTALGAELRETKIEAIKPRIGAASNPTVMAMYKGPFRELVDDEGRIYRRGERVTITAETAEQLQASCAAEQFVFLPESDPSLPMLPTSNC